MSGCGDYNPDDEGRACRRGGAKKICPGGKADRARSKAPIRIVHCEFPIADFKFKVERKKKQKSSSFNHPALWRCLCLFSCSIRIPQFAIRNHLNLCLCLSAFPFSPNAEFADLRRLTSDLCHLITLSARNSTDCGIVRPICFAVLRLIISSNFVGPCTGRSAGLAPFRILSTYVATRR
jgi:hypothetical protein